MLIGREKQESIAGDGMQRRHRMQPDKEDADHYGENGNGERLYENADRAIVVRPPVTVMMNGQQEKRRPDQGKKEDSQ